MLLTYVKLNSCIYVCFQGNFDVESVRNEILKRWNVQVTKAKQELPNGRADSFFGGGDLLSPKGSADQTENVQQCSKTNGIMNDTESVLVNKMETIFKMTEEQISSKASSSSGSSAKSKGDIGADSALRAAILSQYCAVSFITYLFISELTGSTPSFYSKLFC